MNSAGTELVIRLHPSLLGMVVAFRALSPVPAAAFGHEEVETLARELSMAPSSRPAAHDALPNALEQPTCDQRRAIGSRSPVALRRSLEHSPEGRTLTET